MFVAIFLATLTVILLLVAGSITYLIYLICEQSDDSGNGDALAVDATDCTSPTISPYFEPPDKETPNGFDTALHDARCPLRRQSSAKKAEIIKAKDEPGKPQTPPSKNQEQSTMPSLPLLETDSDKAILEDDGSSNYIPKTNSVSSDRTPPGLFDSTSGIHSDPGPDEPGDPNEAPAKNPRIDASRWNSDAASQKGLIMSLLGPLASKQLLDDFDQRDMAAGGTGLHWCRSRKSVDRLVELGVPLNSLNRNKESPIHVAVRRRKLPVLIGLLCHGVDVDCQNMNGDTPLIIASRINDSFASQILLVFDADPDRVDFKGHSARHYSAHNCEKMKDTQRKLPIAAHLILAMLNEMGARRCSAAKSSTPTPNPKATPLEGKDTDKISRDSCTDGCSATGTYDGKSYDRWPNYRNESLYKRHMFSHIIETLRHSKEDKGKKDDSHTLSRLLCIDGGGMRGVIVCELLIEVEKYLKKPLASYFDWLGGTSAGAYLVCALSMGKSLIELRRITFSAKDEVFSGNRPYSSKSLERFFKRTFGATTRMSQIGGKKVAVTTVVADRDPCQLRFFRNYLGPHDLLETHGYPAHRYDGMSAHSIVSPSTQTNGNNANRSLRPSGSSKSSESRDTRSNVSSELRRLSAQARVARAKKSDAFDADKEATDNSKHERSSSNATTKTVRESSEPGSTKVDYDSSGLIEGIIEENEQDPLIWQAIRASSAAPFFFRPYGPFLDGGIIANNPTMDMLTEFYNRESVKRFLSANPVPTESKNDIRGEKPAKLGLVVSLGTGRGKVVGRGAMMDFGHVATNFATVFSPVELLKSIRAARDLFKKVVQQSCQTEEHILDRAQAWCWSLGVPYFRLNPPLMASFSIDDKRDEQIINALWQTKLYIVAMRPQIKELCALLDGD